MPLQNNAEVRYVGKTESTNYGKCTEKITQEGENSVWNSLVLSQAFTSYISQKKKSQNFFFSFKLNLIEFDGQTFILAHVVS